MQQNRRPLIIVNSDVEEIRIERYDLEWKVGGGICVMMANLHIPPVVSRTITDQSPQHECLSIKTIRVQNRNRPLDCLAFIVAELIGG